MSLIDAKQTVRNLLLANTDLTTLLGGDQVYSVLAPTNAVYPYITIQEVGNAPIDYADNTETRAEISIQVDIWSKGNYSAIASLVNDILTSAEPRFVREHSADLAQTEPLVLHKALRYWTAPEV
ncbi:DUF3168 domain-containing protein [Alicyclobacillus sp. ALC3]|uniref:DUF3168 domain-containing protein n=1 Tax=Alicyclobacillus sp. ALC3 TaxID=2796143 RepID=UPI002379FEAC|nr:DUF3168 domain-containing protein [Alicyclobacillus sp. ALC3]WDL98126.1 DUF3168 domain-containing protein [Alicyclobacillus sp. ALC3]